MKKIILLLLLPMVAMAQKPTIVTYEFLTTPANATLIDDRKDILGIEMPDGTIFQENDIVVLGTPFNPKNIVDGREVKEMYSSLIFGGALDRISAMGLREYVPVALKGEKLIIKSLDVQEKNGTIDVKITCKFLSRQPFAAMNRITAFLEALNNGELIKG